MQIRNLYQYHEKRYRLFSEMLILTSDCVREGEMTPFMSLFSRIRMIRQGYSQRGVDGIKRKAPCPGGL